MAETKKLTNRPLVLLLTLVQFTCLFDFNMIMPLGAKLMINLSISEKQLGLLTAAYCGAAFISGCCAISWMERFNRRKTFLSLYAGFIFGSGLCSLTRNEVLPFILARAFTGAFTGVLVSCLYTLVGDIFDDKDRGKVVATIMTAGPLSLVLGVPFGLWISNITSWHWIYACLTLLSIFGWTLAYFYLPNYPIPKNQDSPTVKDMFMDGKVRKVLTILVAQTLGPSLILPFVSAYLIHNIGLSQSKLPLVYLITNLAVIIIAPLAGRMSDSWGLKKTYCLWLLVSALMLSVLTFTNNLPFIFVFITFGLFMCFNQGRKTIVVALTLQTVSGRSRGKFIALCSAIQSLVLAGASSVGGVVLHSDNKGIFTNFPILGMVSVMILLFSLLPMLESDFQSKSDI